MARMITLLAGPTASGKSALALRLARQSGAHIVNADSMQVYDVLRVLTARPDATDLAAAPHHLYGHVAPSVAYSTGQWVRDVRMLLDGLRDAQPLILVGGTGLYFRALIDGLSPMPDVPAAVRDHFRARLAGEGAPSLHADLARRDPEGAVLLQPTDGQRIVRALEVLEASGHPLRVWQAKKTEPVFSATDIGERIVLMPDRAALAQRIETRFDAMIDQGAFDEVLRLRAMELPEDRPAIKAIGVRELGAVLDGAMTEMDAITRAKAATRQYAKRQMTWFRNQFDDSWRVVADPATVEPG